VQMVTVELRTAKELIQSVMEEMRAEREAKERAS